jgi:transcriptional regulator with XRE-family HTH domain
MLSFFMNNLTSFSDNLILIRKKKGISQKELSQLTNISPRMIAHYEKHVSHPSLEKISVIARALNVNIEELLGLGANGADKTFSDFISKINTKTIKQFKKIMKLNPIDRSTIYKMVDGLLKKEEYKNK